MMHSLVVEHLLKFREMESFSLEYVKVAQILQIDQRIFLTAAETGDLSHVAIILSDPYFVNRNAASI